MVFAVSSGPDLNSQGEGRVLSFNLTWVPPTSTTRIVRRLSPERSACDADIRSGPFLRLRDSLNVLLGCDRVVPRARALYDIFRLVRAPRARIVIIYGRFGIEGRIDYTP